MTPQKAKNALSQPPQSSLAAHDLKAGHPAPDHENSSRPYRPKPLSFRRTPEPTVCAPALPSRSHPPQLPPPSIPLLVIDTFIVSSRLVVAVLWIWPPVNVRVRRVCGHDVLIEIDA